jgi:adenylylsulfate kinase
MNSLSAQKGMVIWLLGLSGAGKSTLAALTEKRLTGAGLITVLLDGDHLRAGINKDLSFSEEDRKENIRRAAEIAKMLAGNNIVTLCSFITPMREQRDLARSIAGNGYFEVYVSCPMEICEQRDVKGLYKRARNNEIPHFTGIGSRFDIPSSADLVIHTDKETPEQSAGRLYGQICSWMK